VGAPQARRRGGGAHGPDAVCRARRAGRQPQQPPRAVLELPRPHPPGAGSGVALGGLLLRVQPCQPGRCGRRLLQRPGALGWRWGCWLLDAVCCGGRGLPAAARRGLSSGGSAGASRWSPRLQVLRWLAVSRLVWHTDRAGCCCCCCCRRAAQVVLWDLAGEWDRAAAAAGGRGGDAEGSEEAAVPVVHHKWASAVEHSHNTQVSRRQCWGRRLGATWEQGCAGRCSGPCCAAGWP
jgi:hypothetical protein